MSSTANFYYSTGWKTLRHELSILEIGTVENGSTYLCTLMIIILLILLEAGLMPARSRRGSSTISWPGSWDLKRGAHLHGVSMRRGSLVDLNGVYFCFGICSRESGATHC